MQNGDRKETKQARNSRGTWSCSQLRESPRPRITKEVWGKTEGFHTTRPSTDHCRPTVDTTAFAVTNSI